MSRIDVWFHKPIIVFNLNIFMLTNISIRIRAKGWAREREVEKLKEEGCEWWTVCWVSWCAIAFRNLHFCSSANKNCQFAVQILCNVLLTHWSKKREKSTDFEMDIREWVGGKYFVYFSQFSTPLWTRPYGANAVNEQRHTNTL